MTAAQRACTNKEGKEKLTHTECEKTLRDTLKPICICTHLKLTACRRQSSSSFLWHRELLRFAPVECNFSSRCLLLAVLLFTGFPFPGWYLLFRCPDAAAAPLVVAAAIFGTFSYILPGIQSLDPAVFLLPLLLPLFTPVAVEIEFHLENIRA